MTKLMISSISKLHLMGYLTIVRHLVFLTDNSMLYAAIELFDKTISEGCVQYVLL